MHVRAESSSRKPGRHQLFPVVTLLADPRDSRNNLVNMNRLTIRTLLSGRWRRLT
jgi:hypothetical protein